MKHSQLRSLGHNIADSLACGMGFVIGVFQTDIFGEAAGSPCGSITVDFLNGAVVEGDASPGLRDAVTLYGNALPDFCAKHGGSVEDFRELKVRYWSTHGDRRFAVTVEDFSGRRSTTEYEGVASKRLKVVDDRGRFRRKPHAR